VSARLGTGTTGKAAGRQALEQRMGLHRDTPSPPTMPCQPRRPRQESQLLAAWQTYKASVAELKVERSALREELASMQQHLDAVAAPGAPAAAAEEFERSQAVETGISRVLQSEDHEAIARALQDNMVGP
jgi:hypothetical protein